MRNVNTPFNPANIRTIFNKLIELADVPKNHFHDLGHTHATLLLSKGVNVKTMHSATHKFFVIKHVDGSIYVYSSEQHLQEINDGRYPFWKDDELILLETDKAEYGDLINRIVNIKLMRNVFIQM